MELPLLPVEGIAAAVCADRCCREMPAPVDLAVEAVVLRGMHNHATVGIDGPGETTARRRNAPVRNGEGARRFHIRAFRSATSASGQSRIGAVKSVVRLRRYRNRER